MLKKGSFLRELPIIVVSALIVSIVVKTFLLHFFYIPTGSMENTLQIGDRIAVNKFGALFSEVKRGEVVVFGDPDNWLGQVQQTDDPKLLALIWIDNCWSSSRSCQAVFDKTSCRCGWR
jgi:signal peptidase I